MLTEDPRGMIIGGGGGVAAEAIGRPFVFANVRFLNYVQYHYFRSLCQDAASVG